jgi:hypothetical protein
VEFPDGGEMRDMHDAAILASLAVRR